MDIVAIMFGSVISTMTALTFLEVRRLRKLIEGKKSAALPPAESANSERR